MATRMSTRDRKIEGRVVSVSCRKTRHPGLWSHAYKIGGFEYTMLARHSVLRFRAGDCVRLKWTSHKGKWRTYRNIVGEPELVRPREDSERADGYIYVLTNPSMEGLVKIGMTTRTPEERCAELSQATSIPTPFCVFWSHAVVGNVSLVESLVHESLAQARSGKEFFCIDPEAGREAILEVYFSLYPEQRNTPNTHEARKRAYEADREKALAIQKALEEERRLKEEAARSARETEAAKATASLKEVKATYPQPSPQYLDLNRIAGDVFGLLCGVGLLALLIWACTPK